MAKSTPFPCDTCGWGGTHPCVVGEVDSAKWLDQIPLHRWHRSRTEKLKKLNLQRKGKRTHVE